jgi:site-specific recombinase XerD
MTLDYNIERNISAFNKLQEIAVCDNLDIKQLDTIVEGIKEEMQRKEILSKHTPAIKQLPSGRWYTRINGKKYERKERKDLEDKIVEVYRSNKITLSSIFPNFIECRKMEVSDTTWSKDIRYFNTFVLGSPIADVPLNNINLDHGYKFLAHCLNVKTDLKKKYWDNIKGVLTKMFQYAIERSMIKQNPFKNLKPKKDLFTPATAVIDKTGKAHGYTVLPHCKTPAGDRRLLLNNKVKEVFDQIRNYNLNNGISVDTDDYIFMRQEKGTITMCTPTCFDHRIRKYCKHAGMSVIKSQHDIRRTVLTNLYMIGMPLKKIQEYAGHSSLKQTMDYIRITDDDIDMLPYLDKLSDEAEDNIILFKKDA